MKDPWETKGVRSGCLTKGRRTQTTDLQPGVGEHEHHRLCNEYMKLFCKYFQPLIIRIIPLEHFLY